MSRNDGIVRGASWLLISRAIGDAGLLVYYLLLARTFGPTGIGDYAFAFAIASFLALGVGFGLRNLIVRRVARDPGEVPEIAATVFVTQLALTLVLGAALVAVARLVGYSSILTGYFILAFLALSLLAIGATFIAFLEAVGAMYLSALASLVQKGIIIVLGVALILGGADLSTVMGAHVLAGAAYLIVAWRWARRHFGRFRPKYRPDLAAGLFIAALPFLASAALWEIYSRIDIVMLHSIRGDVETGLYASAYKLISAPLFVAALVGVAAFPTLARSADADRSEMSRVFRDTVRALAVLGLVGGVLLVTVGDGLQVTLFGSEFAESGLLVRWMAPLFVLEFLMVPQWRLLLALNRERTLLLLRVGSVGLNVGLNLVLIPAYGAKGAVVSSLISEGLLALVQSVLCMRIVPSMFGGHGASLVFVGVVTVAAGLLSRMVLPWPLVAIAVGVVLAVLVLALGLVSPSEIRQLLREARLSKSPETGRAE